MEILEQLININYSSFIFTCFVIMSGFISGYTIIGKVSEIMYNEISKEYEIELTKISDKIEESSKLNKDKNELGNSITKFIDEVSKYSLNDSLSKELLNKLIKEIRVHESEVIDGERVQNVEIIYNFMP